MSRLSFIFFYMDDLSLYMGGEDRGSYGACDTQQGLLRGRFVVLICPNESTPLPCLYASPFYDVSFLNVCAFR